MVCCFLFGFFPLVLLVMLVLRVHFLFFLMKSKCDATTYRETLSSRENKVVKMLLRRLNRNVFRIGGTEVDKFLYDMCTQDVNAMGADGSTRFSLFLANNGRILCDAFLQRETNESFLVDSHS